MIQSRGFILRRMRAATFTFCLWYIFYSASNVPPVGSVWKMSSEMSIVSSPA